MSLRALRTATDGSQEILPTRDTLYEKSNARYFYFADARRAAWGKAAGFLYEHSGVCRLLLCRQVAWRRSQRPQPRQDEMFQANRFHERDWLAIEAEFAHLSELCAINHAQLVLIHLPPGAAGERLAYPARRLSDWCAHNHIQFIDILPAMKKAPAQGEPLCYEKDGHR